MGAGFDQVLNAKKPDCGEQPGFSVAFAQVWIIRPSVHRPPVPAFLQEQRQERQRRLAFRLLREQLQQAFHLLRVQRRERRHQRGQQLRPEQPGFRRVQRERRRLRLNQRMHRHRQRR